MGALSFRRINKCCKLNTYIKPIGDTHHLHIQVMGVLICLSDLSRLITSKIALICAHLCNSHDGQVISFCVVPHYVRDDLHFLSIHSMTQNGTGII